MVMSFSASSLRLGRTQQRSSSRYRPSAEPLTVPVSPCCHRSATPLNGLQESLGSVYRFERIPSSISAMNASASAR